MTEHFISIILPVHNQSNYIGAVIDSYNKVLSELRFDYELLLVINGCSDNSLEVCNNLSEKYKSVRVLQSDPAAWGRAVKLGLKEAKGDLLCYTNSARTSTEDLKSCLLYAIANPDTVIKADRKIRERWIRRLGSLLYNIECRTLFDLSNWDINGTPKIFSKKFDKLLMLSRDDDLIDLEFSFICRTQSYPMLEFPIFSSRRYGGQSTTGYRSAIAMYLGVLKMRYELKNLPVK